MSVFTSLFLNLLPLYGLIFLGWAAGRFLHVDRHSLGSLAIYLFMPIVVFGFVVKLEFQPSFLFLPVLVFLIGTVVSLSFLQLGKRIYGDNRANLMAMCASMGNTGYFGLPLVLLFFTEAQIAVYVFMMLGISVFEATIAYYIAARGNFDVRTSLTRIARFPAMYAIVLALIVNAAGGDMPQIFWTYWDYFKGAYVIIGMMIVGVALSKLDRLVFGWRFAGLVFAGRFGVYPLLAYLFIVIDRAWLHWYAPDAHQLVMIISIVPPAANIAAFAAQLDLQPEKAATTILMGTVFALFYIPAVIWLMGIGV